MKPSKATSTKVDTIEIDEDVLKRWKKPGFQRELRVNAKVEALAEELKTSGGVIPGILTIGVFEKEEYLLDGQHRVEAFRISALPVAYADVRYFYADSMAEMGEEFVRLNSSLVRLKPDDILRGLEAKSEALQYIRGRCKFIGYDQIRRGTRAPIVGMSMSLRCWMMAVTDTPSKGAGGGLSAAQIARVLSPEEAKRFSDFMILVEKAWGRDQEYARLYGGLNLTLCMWLYRRLVINPEPGWTAFEPDLFRACMASLSADGKYLEYLVGRTLGEHARSPTYARIKAIVAGRARLETKKRISLPSPAWATSSYDRPTLAQLVGMGA